jgi:integrase
MRGQGFVLDAVRAMYEWAADADRGHLLPAGFRNPFRRRQRQSVNVAHDDVGAPDITMAMAAEFFNVCDDYQLPLFTVLLFFGLRAAEPVFLFGEFIDDGWLRVPCLPELAYATKGRRDKRFPLVGTVGAVLDGLSRCRPRGPLFLRRAVIEGRQGAPFKDQSLAQLVQEFQRRCAASRDLTAAKRIGIRDAVLHEAGGMSYDDIEFEFRRVARKLNWPAKATLKDLRHLFATAMADAGMPEHYRRYLMGHAPGKDAIYHYTHLDQLREQFEAAVMKEFAPVTAVLEQRGCLGAAEETDA